MMPGGEDTAPVYQLARELNDHPEHALQVCKNALALFEATTELHGLGRRERPLLEAAALLHDIGLRYGAAAHHKRSRDLILTLELPGFTEDERAIIACIARYHRKAHPECSHKLYRDLGPITQGVVRTLAGILRIADGLDRSHACSVKKLDAIITPSGLEILVEQAAPNDLDLWGGARKRRLLEEVLGNPILVVATPAPR